MSLRVQNPLRHAVINGLSEIRNAAYPLDLTLRGQMTLLDGMDELEARHGRYVTQASCDSLQAELDHMDEIFAARDLEDIDSLASYR